MLDYDFVTLHGNVDVLNLLSKSRCSKPLKKTTDFYKIVELNISKNTFAFAEQVFANAQWFTVQTLANHRLAKNLLWIIEKTAILNRMKSIVFNQRRSRLLIKPKTNLQNIIINTLLIIFNLCLPIRFNSLLGSWWRTFVNKQFRKWFMAETKFWFYAVISHIMELTWTFEWWHENVSIIWINKYSEMILQR